MDLITDFFILDAFDHVTGDCNAIVQSLACGAAASLLMRSWGKPANLSANLSGLADNCRRPRRLLLPEALPVGKCSQQKSGPPPLR